MTSTPKVGYTSADGSANTARPTGITYPNGEKIAIGYHGVPAEALSRANTLQEGGKNLCSYQFFGMNQLAGIRYEGANNLEFTREDGGKGDAGDQYTGLDRFGRVAQTLWKSGSSQRVHSRYGHHPAGAIAWRKDELASSLKIDTQDNSYLYDGLYQVKQHLRGKLAGNAAQTAAIRGARQEENWGYDPTGNWSSYRSEAPANAQDRSHNAANEITRTQSPEGDIAPRYDAAGNMVSVPATPGLSTKQYKATWDAWNRLVELGNGASGRKPVARYDYDGQTRRITRSDSTGTRQYFYNDQWRAIEERVEGAGAPVDRQYTWGLTDRWELVRRKRSTGGSRGLDETLFVLRDYLDPVAIADPTGTVVERYGGDAFGPVRIMGPEYAPRPSSNYEWEFLFHGEFMDQETGFYNYGYRYYTPSLGRWISRDPLGDESFFEQYTASMDDDAYNAAEDESQNPGYLFVGNNPINSYDLHGCKKINGSGTIRLDDDGTGSAHHDV